ncbi:hypothetical protein D3C73_578140 [compost metagenome]
MYLGPIYIGKVDRNNEEASYRRILSRLYYITEHISQVDEYTRLLLLSRIHSVKFVEDAEFKRPAISKIQAKPYFNFMDIKIEIRMSRYKWEWIREFVEGNFREELLHGALYALMGSVGEGEHAYYGYDGYKRSRRYFFTPWLRKIGIQTGPGAIFALKNWQHFFMTECIDGVDYLFNFPQASVPDRTKIFTRRALHVQNGERVSEGTLEDFSVFTHMLNLYLGESLITWIKSSCKVRLADKNECKETTAVFDGTYLQISLPDNVHIPWSDRLKGQSRRLELHYTVPQFGTVLFLMCMYAYEMIDTSRGLGKQFVDMRLHVNPFVLFAGTVDFKESNGTILKKISADGTTYLGLLRFKSAVWYFLDLDQGRYIPVDDVEYRKIEHVISEEDVN